MVNSITVTGASVTIGQHCEDDFALGKVHKEIAQFLVAATADDSITDQAFIVVFHLSIFF